MNGSMVKNDISFKNGIRIICNTENFVPIVVPGLSSSSSGSSSTLRTPMKQESHSSSSSSSSPSSPTVGEIPVREREDAPKSDISPVPVSELVDDRTGKPMETQANDGSRDLSDLWTGFTQFTHWKKKPPNGQMWSGERLTRKQHTSRPDHLWPELWDKMGKNAKLKEKQKWSHEKPQLDNARKLRGIYLLIQRTRNSKRPSRMLVRNWKHQLLLLCLVKL